MKDYEVIKYEASHKNAWDEFIRNAKNATFLFERDFMDYHADRFTDHSLMVFKKGKLVTVLPANIQENTLHSHQGLTYGGLVLGKRTNFEETVIIFTRLLKFLESQGVTTLNLKLLPNIYHLLPSDEIAHLLFVVNAKLTRRDISSTIFYDERLAIKSSNRKRGIKRGIKNGLEVREDSDFEKYWDDILVPNLNQTHGKDPVHSVAEIELLHSRFPKNIKQFNVYKDAEILAGVTVFETPTVAHCQYISSNTLGRNLGALDFLFDFLIDHYSNKRYFDFGISNEAQGRKVNKGLIHWKEAFGGRSIAHDFYEVDTAQHHLLNDIYL